jgi:hypothetical protein
MKSRPWVFALLILAGSALPARAHVELKWKFTEGSKFYLESKTNMKQKIEVQGMAAQNQDMVNTTLASYEILKANAEGTVLQQKIESMKIEMKGGLEAAADVISKMTKQMEGATFKVTLSPAGKITQFEGFEDFMKRLEQANPQAAPMLKSFMSKETMSKGSEEAFGFLPAKPVKPGDTWKKGSTLSLGPLGSFKVESNYIYKGKVDNGEAIDVDASMSFTPPAPDANAPFQITKTGFKAESAKGTIIFDPKTGRLVKQDMKIHMKGPMTIKAGGMEITMDMDQDQSTTVRLLDKKPAD